MKSKLLKKIRQRFFIETKDGKYFALDKVTGQPYSNNFFTFYILFLANKINLYDEVVSIMVKKGRL